MHSTTPSQLSPQDHTKITDFLMGHPIGVLATVNQNGDPQASTIYYAVDSELNVTFTTKTNTLKNQNIMRHNMVMMAVYDSETQSSVQVQGVAEQVQDPEEAQKIYHGTLHAAKQTGPDNVPPIAKIPAGPYVAYRVKPTNIWMKEYGWGDSFATALDHANDLQPTDDPS